MIIFCIQQQMYDFIYYLWFMCKYLISFCISVWIIHLLLICMYVCRFVLDLFEFEYELLFWFWILLWITKSVFTILNTFVIFKSIGKTMQTWKVFWKYQENDLGDCKKNVSFWFELYLFTGYKRKTQKHSLIYRY